MDENQNKEEEKSDNPSPESNNESQSGNENTQPIVDNPFSDIPGRDSHGNYTVSFHGSYKQYLGIALYNLLLTVITLGFYYPWAKCAIRKFLWQETEIAGSRFEWHGTGKEMFKGFIKAYAIVGVIFIVLNFGQFFIPPKHLIWAVLGCYLLILMLIPIAIHGMMRYRLSRTSLRGIHMGYRGNLKEFYKQTSIDFLITILTLGIYGSWLQINVRKYVMKNSRYGNVSARFIASGGDLFWLSIGQGLLVAITFYIYLPWAIIQFFRFYVENTTIVQNEHHCMFKTNAKGGRYFIEVIKAVLITVVTFGIAAPIGELMIHKYLTQSITFSGAFNFDDIKQTEKSYTDATGDDMADIFDLDF